MTDEFRRHAGWCEHGQPPDGRRRLDLFPDWGAPLPIWHRGRGCFDLALSTHLRDRLVAWASEWEGYTVPAVGSTAPPHWHARWVIEATSLALDVEAETGAVVVVLEPDDPARADDCPTCGRPPHG